MLNRDHVQNPVCHVVSNKPHAKVISAHCRRLRFWNYVQCSLSSTAGRKLFPRTVNRENFAPYVQLSTAIPHRAKVISAHCRRARALWVALRADRAE